MGSACAISAAVFLRVDYLSRFNPGVTLPEVLVVIAVALALATAATPLAVSWRTGSELSAETSSFVQALRRARAQSVSRISNQSHGVYLEINPTGDDRYVVFQGASYASRDPAVDESVTLPSTLTLMSTWPGNEVVFSRGLGLPSVTGVVTITHAAGVTSNVSVVASGLIEIE